MTHQAFTRVGALVTALLHVALLVLVLLPPSHVATAVTVDPQEHPETVKAVVGRTAKIPCLVTTSKTDKIVVISWTKRGIKGRVFSVDMRNPDNPSEYAKEEVFGNRAQFQLENGMSYMKLEDLKVEDAGHYTCEMDIKKKRTQKADSTLKIIVPPGDPTIFSEDGTEVKDELGPYNEGATINVTCQVEGGQPSPRVSWYQEEQVLDEEAERRENQVVRNTLRLGPLTRKHLGAKYLCQAFNSDQVGPRSKEVTLLMYLMPLGVRLNATTDPPVVGQEYFVTCESWDGLPPAEITWSLPGEKINTSLIFTEIIGNLSRSTLKLQPKMSHAGKNLSCHAKSPKIHMDALTATWPLRVQYAPNVTLKSAQGLNLHNVSEGDNVTLMCEVKAIPPAWNISWYHKHLEVNYNASAGIVKRGNSLILRNVTRRQSGLYTCHATNKHGLGKSRPIVLNVMYVPFCKETSEVVRGAAKQDDVELECNVRGSPGNITFSWYYLTSDGRVRITDGNYESRDLTSLLTYRVQDDSDYREVVCFGENLVGIMKEPCRFKVIPAGKPEPLDNCTVYNQTSEALFVFCLPGYNGGLDQHFVVQVFEDVEGIRLNIHNFTEKEEPKFTVDALRAGTEYLLSIYSQNEKGKSEERKIYGFTLPAVGRPVHIFPITPVLGVLIGVVGALVLVAIVVVVVMKLKGDSRGERILHHVPAEGVKLPHAPLNSPKDDATYENVGSIPPKLKHANIYETVPYDKEKSSNNESCCSYAC